MRVERHREAGVMTNWNGNPKAGTVWRVREVIGTNRSRQETRRVIDRTFGGDVYFVSGRITFMNTQQRCTLKEWQNWAADAKELK